MTARTPKSGTRAGVENTRPKAAAVAKADGGRLSVDTAFDLFGMPPVLVPPNSPEDVWRFVRMDNDTLRTLRPSQLMEMLADLSPEVSRALWDFMRFCNSGWTITCLKPGGTTPNTKAQAIVDTFMDQLTILHGSPDVVFGRLFMAAFLRGMMVAELVLDLDGRTMVDLATPDPISIRYQHIIDPVRGPIYIPVQWQNRQVPEPVGIAGYTAMAGYIPLTRPTIWITPVDPFPGSPYGRSMVGPALFSSHFLLGLLHDLRRVIRHQGYPRIDVALSVEKLLQVIPPTIKSDPAKLSKWMNDELDEVLKAYSTLEPDDTYIHWDTTTVNKPVGAVSTEALGAVGSLIEAIERMTTRALKTMPFLQASSQSSSESQAAREWEVMAAGVKSIQHPLETMLGRLLELGCQAAGEQSDITVQFAELRASEMLRDAQTTTMLTTNAFNAYSYGWISQDEAAETVVGHKADVPEPRLVSTYQQTDPDDVSGGVEDPATAGNGGEEGEETGDAKRSKPLRVVGSP